jgi:hypothetical protein
MDETTEEDADNDGGDTGGDGTGSGDDGSTDGGSDSDDTDGGSGDGGTDGDDTVANVPSDVPSGYEGFIDGTSFAYMEFIESEVYEGDSQLDPYSATTVVLYESEDAVGGSVNDTGVIALELLDEDTNASEISDGQYDLWTSEELNDVESLEEYNSLVPGTHFAVVLVGGSSSPSGSHDYAAGNGPQSNTLHEDASSDTYDEISSGTVQVSVSDGVYTIEWNFQTGGGETISGSYTGAPDLVSTNLQ